MPSLPSTTQNQSAASVVSFYSVCSLDVVLYPQQILLGFIEELVVESDPEFQMVDTFRTARASNHHRQLLLHRIAYRLRALIALKVRKVGGNAVLGFQMQFDMEGDSGIVGRAYGTSVRLVAASAGSPAVQFPVRTRGGSISHHSKSAAVDSGDGEEEEATPEDVTLAMTKVTSRSAGTSRTTSALASLNSRAHLSSVAEAEDAEAQGPALVLGHLENASVALTAPLAASAAAEASVSAPHVLGAADSFRDGEREILNRMAPMSRISQPMSRKGDRSASRRSAPTLADAIPFTSRLLHTTFEQHNLVSVLCLTFLQQILLKSLSRLPFPVV